MRTTPLIHTKPRLRSDKLIVHATSIPDSVKVRRVVFIWPCLVCGKSTEVSKRAFLQLESKQLLGIKCKDCLKPPAFPSILLAA